MTKLEEIELISKILQERKGGKFEGLSPMEKKGILIWYPDALEQLLNLLIKEIE